jgi:RNA polymerase sigma-70 factor (ECF subfamily)
MSTPIRRAVAGDLEALAALLEEHGPGLRAHLRGRIPAAHRGVLAEEDVLQVSYLEAFLRIASFAGDTAAAFRGWLRAIAEHNLRDGVRELERRKRPDARDRVDAGERAAEFLEELRSSATTPTRAAARGEARALLEAALAELPADYARVVRLYDLEGRSAEETAAALGRSRGATHMLRQRALDRLREKLGPPARFVSQEGRA